ncbi:MAG: site-2 protease family protein [Chlamydiales bacterium]
MIIPGKIPISIHPLFWLVAFFIGWMWAFTLTGALICVGVILFSILIHELGHALTAILFQQKVRIELAAFGGFTYREGPKLNLWKEFLVVLNGPIAGCLLVVIFHTFYQKVLIQSSPVFFVVKFAFVMNFFWTIFNLVPILPLDGGHLLSILLEAIFGFKGLRISIVISLGISIITSVFFFAVGMFLIGALFLMFTFESFRSLRYYKIFNEKDRDTHLQELIKSADIDLESGFEEQALQKLEKVRKETKKGILYTLATQEIAEIYRHQERYEEAYQLLIPMQKNLSGESLATFHFLAYMNEDYQTVIDIGNKCYQDHPSADTALINALTYGILSRVEPAVGWLECALREGLTSVAEAISREEFDSIRDDPQFLAFTQANK